MTETWFDAYKVDSFTTRPFDGNPAGVVFASPDLSDDEMRAMAREMNLSETAFVAPDPVGEADHRIRYWSPTEEVPFCGHATIAALHMLARRAAVDDRDPAKPVTLSSRVGLLQGVVQKGVAWTTTDKTQVEGLWPDDDEIVLDALQVGPDALAPEARPVLLGGHWMAVEMRDVSTLDALKPDLGKVAALRKAHDVEAIIAFTQKGVASGRTWHQRVFAPSIGIPEDPTTGAASARMAGLLVALRRFSPPPDGRTFRFLVRQRDGEGRMGEVEVVMEVDGEWREQTTRIGGQAVMTLEGRMRRPRV